MKWHITENEYPEHSGLYLVTKGAEGNYYTSISAFIRTLSDWEYCGNPEEYVDDEGELIEFPVWLEAAAWMDEREIYPDDFHWYMESDPQAWMEFPDPCTRDYDPESETQEQEDINYEIESLENLW